MPSVLRPGRISDDLRTSFERAGYFLATTAVAVPRHALAEVYPHPALIELRPRNDGYRIRHLKSPSTGRTICQRHGGSG
jgi:hypothetical protein